MIDLTSRLALVTGAASGIGKACADRLETYGATVVRTDINATDPRILSLDVRGDDEWKALLAGLDERHDRLDILVNAAGVSLVGDTVDDCTPIIWNQIIGVNLDGPFLGMKHAIPLMRRRGSGSIVNIGSIMGHVGDGGAAAYVASKGGLRLLTKSVALHCARSAPGIRCNSVSPGYIDTALLSAWAAGAEDGERQLNDIRKRIPSRRFGRAEEVAGLVAYLASDLSSAVTGSDFILDGGYTAQ